MRLTTILLNSRVDFIYRSVLLSKFFVKGWGSPEHMKQIFNFRKTFSKREHCMRLVSPQHPIYIDKCVEKNSDYFLYEGHFLSPMVNYLPVPESCRIAKFQMIIPSEEKLEKLNLSIKPMVVHLAGTGDHFYWKRRVFMAKPLLEYGVGSILLENPYYGYRKPPEQRNSCLLNVSDLFVMGACLVLECLALFHWLEKSGYGPLGVTGISMGGHMASLAGCSWNKPISIVPCLSWTTASCVFTQGVLSGSIPWDLLKEQYKAYGKETIDELQKLLESPENNDIFNAGRQFARQFPVANKRKVASVNSAESGQSVSDFFASQLKSIYGRSEDNGLILNEEDDSVSDVLNFMRGIMDECTHLGNFDKPVDSELSFIVNATHDGYVPRTNIISLNDLWPGSCLRQLDCGHVTAILFNTRFFQQAILDSLDLNAQKYYGMRLLQSSSKQLKTGS